VNLDDFVARWEGQYAQAPGGLGGQCVDLVELWVIANGLPRFGGNAIDQAGHSWPGASWVANVPGDLSNFPSPGDCVVWGDSHSIHGPGVFGHIDICLAAGPDSFDGFDQNWPAGAPCSRVHHTYFDVLGWQALGVAPTPSPPPPQPPPPQPPPPQPPPPLPLPTPTGVSGAALVLLAAGLAAGGWLYLHRRERPLGRRELKLDLTAALELAERDARAGGRLAERELTLLERRLGG